MNVKKNRPLRIPAKIQRRILAESRMLHVSTEEYLALITQIAASIRGAVLPEGLKDSAPLQSILENPLMLEMASTLASTIWQQLQSTQDQQPETTTDARETPTASVAPPELRDKPHTAPAMVMIDPITGQIIHIQRRPLLP
ncbi:hypothetical protein [Sulfoacidibacillus thermotolerans]|uniref:Uncharacterized protein n=1 Tax=Sulfoacidibacillus thermotolerans TaxID=1765684 RepID=A0A2U3D8W7_SULT2|nr:hypothetical protein [Sulfoacidibacillus thermotolerans]PWI57723.1 hypothetical protein BM613_06980 [Sulfoacidibacillus thermotolerans]